MPYCLLMRLIEDETIIFRMSKYSLSKWKHKQNIMEFPAKRRKKNPKFQYFYRYFPD